LFEWGLWIWGVKLTQSSSDMFAVRVAQAAFSGPITVHHAIYRNDGVERNVPSYERDIALMRSSSRFRYRRLNRRRTLELSTTSYSPPA
jgi:hypothetical protein